MRAAFDFGLSNSDIVIVDADGLQHRVRSYQQTPDIRFLQEVLKESGYSLDECEQLAVSGGRYRVLPDRIGALTVHKVNEIEAIGRGGRHLAGPAAEAALVVSAGSGTALVVARGEAFDHAGGSAVGGGTMLGLARLLLGSNNPREIDALALQGNSKHADLTLGDVVSGPVGHLPPDATAVNFGRLAREDLKLSREDLAAALVTMIGQTIALMGINAARANNLDKVVVVGHMNDMASMRRVIASVGELYHLPITLPQPAGHATALGALLGAEKM